VLDRFTLASGAIAATIPRSRRRRLVAHLVVVVLAVVGCPAQGTSNRRRKRRPGRRRASVRGELHTRRIKPRSDGAAGAIGTGTTAASIVPQDLLLQWLPGVVHVVFLMPDLCVIEQPVVDLYSTLAS